MAKDETYIGFVNLKNDTIFGVGKFAILWNVFEDYKCTCECTHEKIKDAVLHITSDRNAAFKKLVIALNNRANSIRQGMSIDDYVSKKLYPTDDSRARISPKERALYMGRVIEFVKSGGETALDGALLAIWRIRNNMFHGLKGHSALDEQKELFEAMCGVLEEIIL